MFNAPATSVEPLLSPYFASRDRDEVIDHAKQEAAKYRRHMVVAPVTQQNLIPGPEALLVNPFGEVKNPFGEVKNEVANKPAKPAKKRARKGSES